MTWFSCVLSKTRQYRGVPAVEGFGYQVNSGTMSAIIKRWLHWETTLVLMLLCGWISALLKLTLGETISLDFLQPLRLTQPAYQSFKGVLTEQQAHPSTSAAADRPQEGDISLVEDMMENLKRRGQDLLFTAGLVAMAKQYHLPKTKPSKLMSAIHTFGKSSSLISKRAATLRQAARCQDLMIGCQPTAVAHRKSGSGSKRHFSAGRHSFSSSVALNTTLAKKH